MSDLVIRPMLTLSTAHLRRTTCRDLGWREGINADRRTNGWLMFVPEDDIAVLATTDDWPAELSAIIELARANSCEYILFDRDAPTTDQLPAFDW